VPVFRIRLTFEIARGIRVFLSVETGIVRDEGSEAGSRAKVPETPVASTRAGAQILKRGRQRAEEDQRVASLQKQLAAKDRRIAQLRRELAQKGFEEGSGISPENIVWIFGAGRTGSTWLSEMMGELKGHTVWFEPWVGALFDPYHLRLEDHKGRHFIFSPRYKKTWLKSIRAFVLEGADARFSEAAGTNNLLVIKEPGGSVGAFLLMEALPESRMVLLIRDPRDVVASWNDAHREGGWQDGRRVERDRPLVPLDIRAQKFVENVGEAKKAYDSHEGRKVLVKYEDLRADTLGTMKRIYSGLEIPVEEGELARAVEKHSWENIPEEEKGEGKFYRKATPGGWREDLTPEQVKMVEEITAPLLQEFYPTSTLNVD
jgi:hypothetical protein